mmetsp:Transcript_1626/g.3787  ORF Transcript_1626/g.3787 Transcript_1626/m.3787 type:complete len:108 (+) Transcript_1626:694-1017(+)
MFTFMLEEQPRLPQKKDDNHYIQNQKSRHENIPLGIGSTSDPPDRMDRTRRLRSRSLVTVFCCDNRRRVVWGISSSSSSFCYCCACHTKRWSTIHYEKLTLPLYDSI